MDHPFSRRGFLGAGTLGLPLMAAAPATSAVPANFPNQPIEMAKEIVTVSHSNIKRVKELVEAHPSLSNAAIDWGFGDWESALGAASHVGNREIAEYLLSKGARPTLFSAAMLGQLEVVKAFVMAQSGVQKITGPHSISLLAHAKAGGTGAAAVFKYLEALGDAGGPNRPPLTAEELAHLKGTYVFGDGPTERVEIDSTPQGLRFARGGHASRLLHLGDHLFHPAGASAVQIRFTKGAGGAVLTVHDPDLILTARRM